MAEPVTPHLSLAVERGEAPFNPDETTYFAYAYLRVLNYRFTLERVGSYAEDGFVHREWIDEETLAGLKTRFQRVADTLGLPLVIDPNFTVPDGDEEEEP